MLRIGSLLAHVARESNRSGGERHLSIAPISPKHLPFPERMDPIGSLYFTSDSRQVITGRPCLPPRPAHSPSTIPATSTTPAASASSSTSRAASRTASSRRGCRSSSTCCTAAPADARRIPATARASSFRCPIGSCGRRRRDLGFTLPPAGQYGAGLVFLPKDRTEREQLRQLIEQTVRAEGHAVLGWRVVPGDDSSLGASARAAKPVIEQLFIADGKRAAGRRRRSRAGALRARALRHPQAGRARRRPPGPRRTAAPSTSSACRRTR